MSCWRIGTGRNRKEGAGNCQSRVKRKGLTETHGQIASNRTAAHDRATTGDDTQEEDLRFSREVFKFIF
jgi:hypothetical protein